MDSKTILDRLKSLGRPENVAGMKRFGITPDHAYGVTIPHLRALAKELGRDHKLAGELWAIDTRETRILAAMVDEPDKVTPAQMDRWAKAFTYWELCDGCCLNLFEKTPHAWNKAVKWAEADHEGTRRGGFVMMARLAVADKKAPDEKFEAFFPLIEKYSDDNRTMVKKAVNWALRQIGKRNRSLHKKAIEVAERIRQIDSKAARWVAGDALRELNSEAVKRRLKQ